MITQYRNLFNVSLFKYIFLSTLLFSTISVLLADPPDWQDNPGEYEFTATISGGIILGENGVQMGVHWVCWIGTCTF